ncbi:hypothetical protein POPTR_015G019901v4 [Populus trichocarpa]|uniref:Uncharacterized protein n=1 Tax=Populus trichocarpa TaxID=3694 RepID=A0ACC0RVJ9_POPTR|nr:hypothetical protein POPTR_015G019901v4 [Populus trichocarpa]
MAGLSVSCFHQMRHKIKTLRGSHFLFLKKEIDKIRVQGRVFWEVIPCLSYKTELRPPLAREEKKKRRGPESFKFLTASEDINQPLLHHYLTVSLSFQPFLTYGSKTDLATVAIITNSITIYQPLLLPSAHPMFSHLKRSFKE